MPAETARGIASRLDPIARRRLAAAVLALALAWRLAALRAAFDLPQESHIWYYADPGEALIHGVQPAEGLAAFHLPLASISAALVFDHAGLSLQRCQRISWLMEALLVLAVACQLESFPGPLTLLSFILLTLTADKVFYYAQAFYTLLILLVAGFLSRLGRRPSPRNSLLAALAIGATLLYRSPLAFFPPLLALFDWAASARGDRARWKRLLLLCAVPYLFLVPWIGTNWINYRRIVPFEYGEGDTNVVTGALGLVRTVEGDWRALVDKHIDTSGGGAVLLWAASEAVRHPVRTLDACARRAFFVFWLRPRLWLLAAAGLWAYRKRREYQVLGLLAFYFTAIHCLMPVQENYFTPLWPLLTLFAASLLARPFQKAPPSSVSIIERSSGILLTGLLGLVLLLCLYVWSAVAAYAGVVGLAPAGAQAALARAVASSPGDVWLLRESAARHLQDGDLAGAAAEFETALRIRPDARVDLMLAWVRMLLGDPAPLFAWRLAGELRDEAAVVGFEAHVFKAQGYLRFGRKAEALGELRAAHGELDSAVVVRGERTPLAARALDRLRADLGFGSAVVAPLRFRPAAERFALLETAAEVAPVPAAVWIDQAHIASERDGSAWGLRFLDKAQTLLPESDDRHEIALCAQSLKDYARAARILAGLTRSFPGNAVYWSDLGVSEYLAGRPRSAIDDLKRALRLDPASFSANMSLGSLYAGQRRYREALETFDRALAAGVRGDRGEIRRSRQAAEDALSAKR